jgi:hypothetical protein
VYLFGECRHDPLRIQPSSRSSTRPRGSNASTNKVAQQFYGGGGDAIRFGLGSVWLSNLRAANVDLDEGMQEWRYRHVKMVERTIGTRPGTGGSTGAQYLRTTLAKPAFPDLWEIRASL